MNKPPIGKPVRTPDNDLGGLQAELPIITEHEPKRQEGSPNCEQKCDATHPPSVTSSMTIDVLAVPAGWAASEGLDPMAGVSLVAPALRDVPATELAAETIVERFGRCSVSPFLTGPDREMVPLRHGAAGYIRVRRWAVLATMPACPPGTEADTLSELLDYLRARRLRPVFAAVPEAELFTRLGLHAEPVAEDPVINLSGFSLVGKQRAGIRHAVSTARRMGMTVVPWSDALAEPASRMSNEWLATKRGGEMGFTLGRFDPATMDEADCRLALDAEGNVMGMVTWHRFDDGRGRVLDLMRRAQNAPNPTMDLLVAESLAAFAADGVELASLGAVPLSKGRLAERIYPTVTLRRYKDKFTPEWRPLFVACPSSPARRVGATVALARAYSPEGLVRALRRKR
jgi:lysylphosphatidylglycerol synthetase-like protein (DUF2156 family)